MMDETKQRIERRSRQAKLAVEHEQDEVARQALIDKHIAEERLAQLEPEYKTMVEHSQKLRQELQELKDKFYDLKNKKAVLVARANVASASKKIQDTIRTVDYDVAEKGFSRIEQKIMAMEVNADVSHELRRMTNPAILSPKVEEELEELKKKTKTEIVS